MQSGQLQSMNREDPVNPNVESGDGAQHPPKKQILTLAEVAEILRCSKAHVCNVINRKVSDLPPMPVVRIGRRVLIRNESLNEWMRAVEGQSGGVR